VRSARGVFFGNKKPQEALIGSFLFL
jgi:hypothetical protein